MKASGRLALFSVVVALGAVVAYVLLLRVAVIRSRPKLVRRVRAGDGAGGAAGSRPRAVEAVARLAGAGALSLLLLAGAWFNFVIARVPDAPTALRVGEQPPDFTLPDAAGRPVALADYRGRKPVVLVFYRGYW